MKILHIPTATTYEWNFENIGASFDEIEQTQYIFIRNGDKPYAEKSLRNDEFIMVEPDDSRWNKRHRPKYEFCVVEE